MTDAELRNFEIINKGEELLSYNRPLWQSIGIKQTDSALFFPAPNVLIPLAFARFMNKRKVTFVDTNEINVKTLISLAAAMKLTNVTVKLANASGKFPLADAAFDVVYSDLGFSTFLQDHKIDIDSMTKELVRILKPTGKLAALDENGAPVMFPCPPEIQAIRAKIDSSRSERLIMGRRLYGAFKGNGLKNLRLTGYSKILTSDDGEAMEQELTRRIAALNSHELEGQTAKGPLTPQEVEKYKAWLKSQISNESFLIQFNTILAIGEK